MAATRTEAPTIRCAIYTRKSTEEGLEQEFNSLDAQREAGQAFIASQRGEGWTCLPDRYDDGGYSGGNMERPALKRLMSDIEAGCVDCVVVYKVDRMSRSLLDFGRMMEALEKHGVSFVSVTQQFNTTSSMGRLTLNILLSFAQFEREIISERTRDKIAATRKKGKWSGGKPILGYDVDPRGCRLVVNEDEAARVRAIFDLYLEHESLISTIEALDKRGWTNKAWTTRKGHVAGGARFNKHSLNNLLTNVLYRGKIGYKGELYEGEHTAIVSDETFRCAGEILRRNGVTGGKFVRNRFGALLKGLIHCAACDRAMTHTHTLKHGKRRYRYYVCTGAQKRGWRTCPSKSIPAQQIEAFVVEQIRCIGKDPALLFDTLSETWAQAKKRTRELEIEQRSLERDMRRHSTELQKLAGQLGTNGAATGRLADLQERVLGAERRSAQVREELIALQQRLPNESEIASALSLFDPAWEMLSPREQARIIRLLVQRVDYHGGRKTVAITFHPAGIKMLSSEGRS